MADAIVDLEPLVEDLQSKDYALDVLGAYVKGSKGMLADMERAWAGGDAGETRRLAHAIKGGALNVGAGRLADASLRLETLAREERLLEAAGLVQEVAREYAKVREWFETETGEAGDQNPVR